MLKCWLPAALLVLIASDACASPTSTPPERFASASPRTNWSGLANINGTLRQIPYQNVDGKAVSGGDMILGEHSQMQDLTAATLLLLRELLDKSRPNQFIVPDSGSLQERFSSSAILSFGPKGKYWPTRTIPYRIDDSIKDSALRERIEDAIGWWNSTGIVTFVPQSSATLRIRSHPLIFTDAPGDDFSCSAYLGYRALPSEQLVYVNPAFVNEPWDPKKPESHGGCATGNIAHEVGHALGLEHEHQRGDRNSYLSVIPGIKDDDPDYGLLKGDYYTSYDPCSVMHYGVDQAPSDWFVLTDNGHAALRQCLMKLKHTGAGCSRVGQRCELSESDVAGLEIRFRDVPNT